MFSAAYVDFLMPFPPSENAVNMPVCKPFLIFFSALEIQLFRQIYRPRLFECLMKTERLPP